MLRSLRVQNFKCLADVTVELEPLTVLIGKNDTGKSSFLNALLALGRLGSGGPYFEGEITPAKLVRHGSHPPEIRWSAMVSPSAANGLPGDTTYSLGVAGALDVVQEAASVVGHPMAIHRSPHIASPATQPKSLNIVDGAVRYAAELRAGWTALAVASRNAHLPTWGALSRSLVTSAIYRFEPSQLAKPSELSEEGATLASDGLGLPSVLDSMLGMDRDAFDAIEQGLCSAIPTIRRIKLVPWRNGEKGGKQLAFGLAGGGDVPAALVSEGVLLLLAYLALTHQPNPPRILLIEEPENGIHPKRLQEVAGYLMALSDPARTNAAQIVVATHSPYFLDFVPPNAVRVFGRRDDGTTQVARLDQLPHFAERIAAGQTLGELWYNVGEDRILEGQVDEAVAGE